MALVYLFLLGVALQSTDGMGKIIQTAIICSVVGVVIYILNKRSARKCVQPKLQKVEELIKTLEP